MPEPGRALRTLAADLSPRAGEPALPGRGAGWTAWLPHLGLVVLAAMAAGVSWHTLIEDFGVRNEVAGMLALAQAVALLIAAFWPMAGWWLALAALALAALVATPEPSALRLPGPNLVTYLGTLALIAFRVRTRVLVQVWVVTMLVGALVALAEPHPAWGETLLLLGAASAAVLATSGALHGRSDALRRLAVSQRRSEAEREQLARLALRTRIARELHDVVAHHLSVIAIQAEAAPLRVADPPAELVRAFATIRSNALDGMGELRSVLDILRGAEPEERPQPALRDVDELLDSLGDAGLEVACEVAGTARALPAGIELSAYRIVQESLSNVLRHAPGSPAHVLIEYRPDGLALDISNTAATAPATASTGGHGQAGMRERTQMWGGTFEAGPLPGDQYAVRVFLPVKEDPA